MKLPPFICQDLLHFFQSDSSFTFIRNYSCLFIFLSKEFRFIKHPPFSYNSLFFCINIISVSIPTFFQRKGLFKSLCSFILYNFPYILFIPDVINPWLISYFRSKSNWFEIIDYKSFSSSFYSFSYIY